MPASTPASAPALPSQLDKAPEPVKPLADKQMGTLATAHGELIGQYGVLGVRYETLREFYKCVTGALNEGKAPEGCL